MVRQNAANYLIGSLICCSLFVTSRMKPEKNSHFTVDCDDIKCPEIEQCLEPVQQMMDGFLVGGCCPGCVYIADIGHSCNSTDIRCRNGLTCEAASGICIERENQTVSKCIRLRERAKSLAGKKFCLDEQGTNEFTGFYFDTSSVGPECDQVTGKYKATQCQSSSCNCVKPDTGETIFGKSQTVNGPNMTCACSLALTKAMEENGENFESAVHLHCQQDGNFARLQCYEDLCYCADPRTGAPISDVVLRDTVKILDCFYETYKRLVEVTCDEKVQYKDEDGNDRMKDVCYCIDHNSGLRGKMRKPDLKVCFDWIEEKNLIGADYSTQCERQVQPFANLTTYFGRKGVRVIGLTQANCDLDGNFKARQCTDSECRCVTKQGDLIKNYRVDRYGNDDRLMRCDCARQEYDVETRGKTYDKLICDLYGNFKALQCFESASRCFCVDENGTRISSIISSEKIPATLSPSVVCTRMRELLLKDKPYVESC